MNTVVFVNDLIRITTGKYSQISVSKSLFCHLDDDRCDSDPLVMNLCPVWQCKDRIFASIDAIEIT
jgi:hypothetical protein